MTSQTGVNKWLKRFNEQKNTPKPIGAPQDKSVGSRRGRSKSTQIADHINLTIGMNLDNNGSAVDAYGSENCGEGYGY